MKKYLRIVVLLFLSLALVGCNGNGGKKTEETKDDSNKITIYMIRHGKTWFNTTEQVQGFSDTPLTEVGIDQAENAGKKLHDIEFDLAFTGMLGRQINTARYILDENDNTIPEIVEHIGFNEWNYGGFEGKTNEEMWNAIGKDYGYSYDSEWEFYEGLYDILGDEGVANEIAKQDPWKNAESYSEITKRGNEAMDELIKSASNLSNPTVLVVSSGSMIPTILKEIVPDSYNGESLDNLSLTIIEYEDGAYTVKLLGDTSYLE